jgi:hypothetical protein
MPRRRSFDEITYEIEHVRPVHPLRTLVKNHFYLDPWVSSEGGLSLAMFNALLFVPFMMALFFYPIQALIGLGALVVALVAVYEGVVLWRLWRRRHAPRT